MFCLTGDRYRSQDKVPRNQCLNQGCDDQMVSKTHFEKCFIRGIHNAIRSKLTLNAPIATTVV